jgi:hypothetical protein
VTYITDPYGNEFYELSPIDLPCVLCGQEAVRHLCNAHGFPFAVHSHGGIHKLDGSVGPDFYCEEHGREVQKFNDTLIRLNKYLALKSFI